MNRNSVLVSALHTAEICTENLIEMKKELELNQELSGKIASVTGGTKCTGKAILTFNSYKHEIA